MIILMIVFYLFCGLKIFTMIEDYRKGIRGEDAEEETEELTEEPTYTRYSIENDPTISERAKVIALACEAQRQRNEADKAYKEALKAAKEAKKEEMRETEANWAVCDIDSLTAEIESKEKYIDFLEDKRDSCTEGSAEWHKWNNKEVAAVHNLYLLNKKLRKLYTTVA